ncbi:unnamed protein product [marine sediment metagenome]|uniref:Uncharacterized protein n=1 Tax=marine sediment metagenome TaxID=412755 RepID=X1MZE0_9ZZZZ
MKILIDKELIFVVSAIIIVCVCVGAFVVFGSTGWTDNEALTDAFLEGEDVGIGCEWKIMSDGTVGNMTKVRLYSRAVYPGATWDLQREGLVDIENNFYWHTYY